MLFLETFVASVQLRGSLVLPLGIRSTDKVCEKKKHRTYALIPSFPFLLELQKNFSLEIKMILYISKCTRITEISKHGFISETYRKLHLLNCHDCWEPHNKNLWLKCIKSWICGKLKVWKVYKICQIGITWWCEVGCMILINTVSGVVNRAVINHSHDSFASLGIGK